MAMASLTTGNDRGVTRRRPPFFSPRENVSDGTQTLKRRTRKRSGRSVISWLVILTASSCFVVVVYTQKAFRRERRRRKRQHAPIVLKPDLNIKKDQLRTMPESDKSNLLALVYPPGIFGGYRNQVIRFLSLVVHALQHDFSQILLPSLKWSTQQGNSTKWVPIPMDMLFDIELWNSFHPKLPLLVEYSPYEPYDCWTVNNTDEALPQNTTSLEREVVQRGFLTPVYSISRDIVLQLDKTTNVRRTDFLPNVSHCQYPVAYGGGTMGGRLWNNYIRWNGSIPYNAQPLVLQALQPHERWRSVATQCVERHSHSSSKTNYIALHARVELEMMEHACGHDMERNLTKILNMVSNLSLEHSINGVFVAVSRSGMEDQEDQPGYTKHQKWIIDNLQAMNRIVGKEGLLDGKLPVFECGRAAMDHYYAEYQESLDYGSVVESIVNFHLAVEATVFVGVRGSSYSTDIWTTRYYQGKGDSNYEYTQDGIVRMDNGGLPPAHSNCKRKSRNNRVVQR